MWSGGGALCVGLVVGWLAGRARADIAALLVGPMAAEVAWLGGAGSVAWFAVGVAVAASSARVAGALVRRRWNVLS